MHEFAFSDVSCPDRHVVLELPLLDFSIGHRVILLRQRNPLLWQPEADFNARPFEDQTAWLIAAVTVCSLPMYPNWWTGFKRRLVSWKLRRRRGKYKAAEWALELAKFRNYLNSSKIITEFSERRDGFPFMPATGNPEANGRALGGPYDVALIQFLIRGLHLTLREAIEFPVALAQVDYMTHLEREGNLRILNADEFHFREQNALREEEAAKAAGFKTVKEHFEHCMAEAKAEKERLNAAEKAKQEAETHG